MLMWQYILKEIMMKSKTRITFTITWNQTTVIVIDAEALPMNLPEWSVCGSCKY